MRQNPIWILLSEVRSAEAVMAVRNSISSGHFILSTIHADKAESIPNRMYSLLESNQDVEQFLKTIYRYVQIGVFVRGRYSSIEKRFVREIAGVCEFHITDDNKPEFTNIYLKTVGGEEKFQDPSKYLYEYLEGQGVDINNLFGENKYHVNDVGTPNSENTTEVATEASTMATPTNNETVVQNKPEQIENLDDNEQEKPTEVITEPVKQETQVVQQVVTAPAVQPAQEKPVVLSEPIAPAVQSNTIVQQTVTPTVQNNAVEAQGVIPVQNTVVTNTTSQTGNKFII
jgi:hypothetical protein